jgi:uncharacterized protein
MKFIATLILLASAFAAHTADVLGPRDKGLIESAFNGDVAEVEVLLDKGASIDATDPKGRTALIWAAANGHVAVVEFLHAKGADVNAQDTDGQTALMYATRGSDIPTVEFLLKHGAEVNAQSSKRGFTALTIAAGVGNVELVHLLLDHGADRNLAESDGNTAVDRARQNGHPAVATLLQDSPVPASDD